MEPTWVLMAPVGPHVGPMNLAIRVDKLFSLPVSCLYTMVAVDVSSRLILRSISVASDLTEALEYINHSPDIWRSSNYVQKIVNNMGIEPYGYSYISTISLNMVVLMSEKEIKIKSLSEYNWYEKQWKEEYRKTYSTYHWFITYPYTMANGSYFHFDDDNKIKRNGWAEYTQPIYCMENNWKNLFNLRHTLDRM